MSQQQTQQQQNQKGQYRCNACGQAFQTQNELKQHEEEKHSRQQGGQNKMEEPQKTKGAGSQDR